LLRKVEDHLAEWEQQGVPRPLIASDQEHVYLAWKHDQFASFFGHGPNIDQNFCEIFQYLRAIDAKEFLIICALWLKCVGFRTVFLCDGRGDEGVDLLASFDEGGLRSIVGVVQAKTSAVPIGRGTVYEEYGKYQMLPHTERFIEYRRALAADRRIEGLSWNYFLVANHSFNYKARLAASRLGILLRSVHQIAYVLSRTYIASDIVSLAKSLGGSLKSDLALNILDKMEIMAKRKS